MRVKVGKICQRCQWYGTFTRSCSYCDLNHKSRLWNKNGEKYDPKYCNKFKEGEPQYDASQWGDKGVIRKQKR